MSKDTKTAADFTCVPCGRSAYTVYANRTWIGNVEKDQAGNWVARDVNDRKLSERRPVVNGNREFPYFMSRKDAVMALWSNSRN